MVLQVWKNCSQFMVVYIKIRSVDWIQTSRIKNIIFGCFKLIWMASKMCSHCLWFFVFFKISIRLLLLYFFKYCLFVSCVALYHVHLRQQRVQFYFLNKTLSDIISRQSTENTWEFVNNVSFINMILFSWAFVGDF